MIKRHTVLLGAGATMAAIPNGDKNGQKSSVMNNLFSELGMDYILKNVDLHTSSKNLEDMPLSSTKRTPPRPAPLL